MKNFLLLFVLMISIQLNAQIIDIPDPFFKGALTNSNCVDTDGDNIGDADADTNNDGEIDEAEALNVIQLDISQRFINSLDGILNFKNLTKLDCSVNQINVLVLDGLNNLKYLDCQDNLISALDVQSLDSLQVLYCSYNILKDFKVNGLGSLFFLDCSNNYLDSLDISGLVDLDNLNCSVNFLHKFNKIGLDKLQVLDISGNMLTTLDVSNLPVLYRLNCAYNSLTSINVEGCPELNRLDCNTNEFESINFVNESPLVFLNIAENPLINIDFSKLPKVSFLYCNNSYLKSINTAFLPKLHTLTCDQCELKSLDLTNLMELKVLSCNFNQINNLTFNSNNVLTYVSCIGNKIKKLDVHLLPKLAELYCSENEITSLDVNNLAIFSNLDCSQNLLEFLYVKTVLPLALINFEQNPNLKYICCQEQAINDYSMACLQNGILNCEINSYCDFTPIGGYDIVYCKIQLDQNKNGCDSTDSFLPTIKYSIVTSTEEHSVITGSYQNYALFLLGGSVSIKPSLENASYFSIVPDSLNLNLVGKKDTFSYSFCIIPNQLHHDLEVKIIPIGNAIPGFQSSYRILYTNKGNQIESGDISLNYNEPLLDFNNATPNPDIQNSGSLSWNYSNLFPFESRTIFLSFQANKPTDTPPLNGGDILDFVASITGSDIDDTPEDNQFDLRQVVVNSFDPNDKTCLEGNRITPDMLGNYVHYLIRFENTGTFPAENIVVKDIIDTTRFDIRSLQIVDQSHPVWARILEGNRVEFIFEHIKLPFADASNDGFVAFKIKTRKDLVLGDSLNNRAEIYFDYNFPIVTNEAQTTVEKTLFTQDFKENAIEIYPNPVKDVLNFNIKEKLHSVEIFDLQGKQVRTFTNTQNNFNVKDLPAGMYWLRAHSVAKIFYGKFVKM